MTKKQWFLVGFAFALAIVYTGWFTDWFQHRDIRISSISRANLSGPRAAGTSATVAFGLDREYRLIEVKVVPLAVWQTNPAAVPIWHLTSDRKSEPVKFFLYGENIDGMQPVIRGAKPQPLESNVTYRLFVSAGSLKGQHDFWIGSKPSNGTNSASK
jgi:hypothetical protein